MIALFMFLPGSCWCSLSGLSGSARPRLELGCLPVGRSFLSAVTTGYGLYNTMVARYHPSRHVMFVTLLSAMDHWQPWCAVIV